MFPSALHSLFQGQIPRKLSSRAGSASLLCLMVGVAPPASAAVLYWDGDGAGVVGGGNGTWDQSAPRWSLIATGSSYQAWNNTASPTDDAVLQNTAGTITLGEPITVRSITARTNAYVLTGSTLTLAGGTGVFDVGTATTVGLTVNSTVAGTAGLTKQGVGVLTLNAANSFTGGTTLTAGTLNLGNNNALGADKLTLAGGTLTAVTTARTLANAVDVTANTTLGGAIAFTFSGPVVLTGSRTVTVSNTALTTWSGGLGETGGAQNFTKAGTGNLLLTAASTYTGNTTISGGTLALGPGGTISGANLTLNDGVLAQGTAITASLGTGAGQINFAATGSGGFAAFGGAVTVTGFTGTPVWGSTASFLANTRSLILGSSIADNVVTWTNDFSLGTAARTITANDNTLSTADRAVISGVISSGAGGALTRNGAGRLDLTAANTYTGATLLQAGTTGITTLGNVSAGASSLGAPATIADGTIGIGSTTTAATLLYLGAGSTTDRVLNLAGTTGGTTLQSDGTGPLVFTSGVTATGVGNKTLTLTGNNTGANAIQGVIANNSGTNLTSVTKSGTGNWTLSGANTHGGTTTLSAGTLLVGHDSALGTGALTLAGGTFAGTSGPRSLANVVNLTGSSIIGGSSNLTFTGAFAQSGGSRTLTVNNSGTTTFGDTSSFTLADNNQARTLTMTVNGGAVSIPRIIQNGTGTGADGLTKSGAGLLELSGANTFNGALTVSAGTLRATGGAATLGAGALSVGTATLDLRADAATLYGRNTTVSGTATITPGRSAPGPGLTHTLGTLSMGTATLALNAGANVSSGTSGLVFGTTTLTGNPTFNPAADTRLTLGPVAGGASARTVTKNGAGELLLSGAGTFTTASALVVNNGIVRLGASNVLGSTPLVNVTVRSNVAGSTALLDLAGFDQFILGLTFGGTGGTPTSTSNLSTGAGLLTLGGTVTYTSTGNPLGSTLSGNVSLGVATRTFSVADSTTAAADLTVSAVVSGASGSGLTKTGTGVLVLSGLNTYTGPTAIQAGTVSINTLGNLSASSSLGAPTTVANGTLALGATTTPGTLLYTGGATSTNRVVNLAGTTGGGVLDASGTGPITFTSALTATGAGSKTLTLRGSNTGNNTFAGAIINNSATNLTSIVKADTGTWIISGVNTNTGATTVNNGILRLGSSASLANSALTVNANLAGATALLDLNGSNATVASLTFGGVGGTPTSASNLSTGSGTLTLGGNVTYTNTGNPLGSTVSGRLALGAAARTFTVNDSTTAPVDLTVSALISGGAGITLNKAGAGTLLLSGANTYAGNTTVSAGTLLTGAVNTLPSTGAVSVASGAVLDLNGFAQTVGSLAGTGGLSLTAATLSAGGDNSSTAWSGIASGTGGLTKTGTGTLTVSGVNTYTGPTTVSAGTLTLSGGANRLSAATALTVTAGATFNLGNNSQTVGSLSGGGAVTQGTGNFTVASAGDSTFSGVVSGNGSFTKQDAGNLTLSGSNSVSGPLSVSAGTLTLSGSSGALASASSISVAGGASLVLDSSAATNANRLGNAAPVSLSGGTLTLRSAAAGTSESLGVFTPGEGNSIVNVDQTGAGAAVLTFAGLGTVDPFASVDFLAASGTLGASATSPQIYITGLASGFIGGWALVGPDFAEYGSFGVRALTGYYNDTDGINVSNVTANVLLASSSLASATTLTNAGTTTDQALLLADVAAVDLNTDATRTLNLASGGLLKITSTATTLSGLGRLTAGGNATGTLSATVQSTGSLTIASSIIDNAGPDTLYGNGDDRAVTLVKGGPGELILTAANTHRGGTQLDAGTLTLGNNAAAGTGTLHLNAGTLQGTGGARTLANPVHFGGSLAFAGIDALTFTGNTTLASHSPLVLAVNTDLTFSGVVDQSGAPGALTKNGNATLTLSGSSSNTYNGTTTVNAGTLQLGKTSGNAINGPLTVASGTVRLLAGNQILDTSALSLGSGGVLALNNFNETIGSLALAGGSSITTGAGTLTLGGNVSHDGTGASSATIAGQLALGSATRTFTIGDSAATLDLDVSAAISGTGGLTKLGTGSLGLSGANTYTGNTTISAGTLRTDALNALSSAVTVDSGATLDLNGFNQSVGSLTGTGNLTLGAGILTSGAANASTTFAGVVSGTGGLAKTGNGTLTLTGANTYTGATTVSAGTLRAENATALGTSAGGVIVASGAALELNNTVNIGTEALTLSGTGVSSGGALRSVTGDNVTNGVITLGNAATITTAAGSLTLGGALSTAGNTVSFNSAGDTAVSGVVSGAGGLTKTGIGDLTLSAANSFSGTTTISAGTLFATHASALGTTDAGTLVASGATLDLSGGIAIGAEALSLAGTGATADGALRSASGANSLAGAITLGAATTISTLADTLVLSGALNTAGNTLTISSDGDTTLSGIVSGTGAVTKTGIGDLTLSVANTFTGTTTISAGTLFATHASALGTTDAGAIVASGATLDLSGGIAVGAEALTLAGNGATADGALRSASGDNSLAGAITLGAAATINTSADTLTLSGAINTAGNSLTINSDGDTTLSGAVFGAGGIIKTGIGDLTLSGANSFTGNLSVSAGTIRIGANDVLADTLPVTLAGGTLDVAGRTETTGTLNLSAASTIDFGASAAAIVFAASNGLTWTGATLTIANYSTGVDSLRFGANASALTATQLGRFRFADYNNATAQIDAFGVVTPVAVPEPAAVAAFAGLATLGCALWRRRRRQSSGTVSRHGTR